MHCARVIPAFTLFLAAVSALAAPPLTLIQDTLYNADGSPFTGNAEVAWRSFTASDGSYIVMNQTSLRVVAGALKVRLVPTSNATSAAYYTVRYTSDGRTMFTEVWVVPPSAVALRVADVRVAAPPSGGSGGGGGGGGLPSTVTINDVVGLTEALAARPLRGQGYLPGRAALVDESGALVGASGDLGDCVRVDGTSGPCGSGGASGSGPVFVDQETPSGAINDTNTVFALASAPSPAVSLHVFRNGILLKAGFDYTLSGSTLTFVAGAVPQSGDTLLASYRK
jgi:hypothetical protein